MKNHRCPFCLKEGERKWLLDQHIPVCDIRIKYFKKELESTIMGEIYKRIHNDQEVEYIETRTFKGMAHVKERFDP
jgi:hypothetical protein